MGRSREEDEAQMAALAQQRDAVVTLIGRRVTLVDVR